MGNSSDPKTEPMSNAFVGVAIYAMNRFKIDAELQFEYKCKEVE